MASHVVNVTWPTRDNSIEMLEIDSKSVAEKEEHVLSTTDLLSAEMLKSPPAPPSEGGAGGSAGELRSIPEAAAAAAPPPPLDPRAVAFWGHVSDNAERYCAATCSAYVFTVVLVFALTLALGPSFFPFTSEVPLYLRGHVTRERMDALVVAKERANLVLNLPAVELRNSVPSLGGGRESLTLEIIYVAKAGSVLETKNVEAILRFEDKIRQKAGFADRCLKTYTDAEFAVQEAKDWDGVDAINNQPHECAVANTIFWACDPAYGYPCESLSSRPIGILDCPKRNATCSRGDMLVDHAFKDAKAQLYSESIPNLRTHDGLNAYNFLVLTDSEFGSGNPVARAIRTEFVFGVPFRGFSNINDDAEGQSIELRDWLYETYNEWLLDDQLDTDEVEYYFYGHENFYLAINEILARDALFAIAAMFFVLFYMAFMKASFFLAAMGVGQIMLSFGPSYLIYYAVFQQRFFGVFNVMSVFIILGIGADDIFVFLDTWEQAGSQHDDLGSRMAFTWAHAGKAMLITSLTTIFSLLSNAASSFPAIRTFGLFAALLVLVNYCAVVIHFPVVVLVYQRHFAGAPFLCGCVRKLRKVARRGFKIDPVSRSDFKATKEVSVDGTALYEFEEPREPVSSRWFRASFASFIIGANVGIVVAFAALLVFLGVSCNDLRADKKQVQFLPRGNNYQAFRDKKPRYFLRGGSIDSAQVDFVWGIDPDQPIDREGTSDTDTENLGSPVWDASFSLPEASRCVLAICQAAQEADGARKTGGFQAYPIASPVVAFHDFVNETRGRAAWDEMTGLGANHSLFREVFLDWAADPDVQTKQRDFVYGYLDADGDAAVRFIVAELKLTLSMQEVEAGEAIKVWEAWEAWFQLQYLTSPCLEVRQYARGFQSSFEWAYVRDVLVKEAFDGIMLSVGLAFIVLFLATQNLLLSFYATATISFIVICTIGSTVLMGWDLGILESVGFVMVPGLSVDFVAHLADSYVESRRVDRIGRVQDMLARTGISIISGAFSTLGATMFLFFPQIVFFRKFGIMIFMTIGYSLLWSLFFFSAIVSTPLGPEGDVGDWLVLARKCKAKLFAKKPEPSVEEASH
eukprot:gene14784-22631_t